jgi:hypothetical protein
VTLVRVDGCKVQMGIGQGEIGMSMGVIVSSCRLSSGQESVDGGGDELESRTVSCNKGGVDQWSQCQLIVWGGVFSVRMVPKDNRTSVHFGLGPTRRRKRLVW